MKNIGKTGIPFKAWIQIDLGLIERNFNAVRNYVGKQTKIIPVVKADAYGHGAAEVAKVLSGRGCYAFGVANALEGAQLRESGIREPILILSPSLEFEIPAILKHALMPTITNLGFASAISKAAKKAGKIIRAHLKIDTGMGRDGFLPAEFAGAMAKIRRFENIKIEGVFTHFARAYSTTKDSTHFTKKQFQTFNRTVGETASQFEFCRHVSNSSAIMRFKKMNRDAVRPGIMLYGLSPLEKMTPPIKLYPALSLRARVIETTKHGAATPVGYGGWFKSKKGSVIATIPVGFADGFPRIANNFGRVLLKDGSKAAIAGRIGMDKFCIEVPNRHSKIKAGSVVTIIGQAGSRRISVEDVANWGKTINYGVVCALGNSKRLPLVFLRNNKIVKIKINRSVECLKIPRRDDGFTSQYTRTSAYKCAATSSEK